MGTVTQTPEPVAKSPPTRRGSVVLRWLDWAGYQKILDAMMDQRFPHTYDRGRLEIMSPTISHEDSAAVFRLIVLVLVQEFGLKMKTAGSTTLRREDMNRGLEPDECFYIRNVDAMRGVRELDLTVLPPPDLAVEVDVWHLSLDRLPVYASLGVPEVWRYRRPVLEIRSLGPDGSYQLVAESPTFPGVPRSGIAEWVDRMPDFDDAEFLDQFRAWVRQQLGRPT